MGPLSGISKRPSSELHQVTVRQNHETRYPPTHLRGPSEALKVINYICVMMKWKSSEWKNGV